MEHVTIHTSLGSLQGCEHDGIVAFRGIPFAQPPVGRLRWRPPQPPQPWAGVRRATDFAPAAPQCHDDPMPLPNTVGEWSEDCLYLNVWTPGVDDARRPVMVWLHGGGFLRGSATRPTYDRAVLARRGDVVFVTVAYRLGALGFLFDDSLPEAANLGLRDQLCALEWVAREILVFGGDPDNVTVFGHSAGAGSIAALLAMPSARGLFRRAILQSGAPAALPAQEALRVGAAFTRHLQQATASRGGDDLRAAPIDAVLVAQRACWNVEGDRPLGVPFLPVVDGELLRVHPAEATPADPVDLLFGTARDEMKPYTLLEPQTATMTSADVLQRSRTLLPQADDAALAALIETYRAAREARGAGTTPGEIWLALAADHLLRLPLTRMAMTNANRGGRTHAYVFSWESPFLDGAFGAFHELELPFLLGYLDDPFAAALVGDRPERFALAENLQDAWTRFARDGVPSASGLPAWPAYAGMGGATMVLDAAPRVDPNPFAAEIEALGRLQRSNDTGR